MNLYRVRYYTMSDGQASVELCANSAEQAMQIVREDFDKYLCAQVISVDLIRDEMEKEA